MNPLTERLRVWLEYEGRVFRVFTAESGHELVDATQVVFYGANQHSANVGQLLFADDRPLDVEFVRKDAA